MAEVCVVRAKINHNNDNIGEEKAGTRGGGKRSLVAYCVLNSPASMSPSAKGGLSDRGRGDGDAALLQGNDSI